MKRRTEHLVEKRDGRTEFLRATKLARSIHSALHSVGVDEDWRAIEIANAVLMALREKHQQGPRRSGLAVAVGTLLKTSELSDAVQRLLVATGQAAAAMAYCKVAGERSRRKASALAARAAATAATATAFGSSNRLQGGVFPDDSAFRGHGPQAN